MRVISLTKHAAILALPGYAAVALSTGCGPEESCAETATCAPIEREGGSDGGSAAQDGLVDGKQMDVSGDVGTSTDGEGAAPVDARGVDASGADDTRIDSPNDAVARDSSGSGGADVSTDTGIVDATVSDASSDNGMDGGFTGGDGATGDVVMDGGVSIDGRPRDASSDQASDGGNTVDAVTACNSTTCPTGCCDANNQCVPSPTNAACGTGGAMCQACSTGQECNGTSCVCTASSCASGCCNGTACVPFAQQSDTQCGAATTCTSCTASMQKCNTSNGQCFCNATSCPNGCCDSTSHCVPYAGQTDMSCGTGGSTCSSCGGGKYCNGNGGCNTSTWCRMQTVPSGVDLADYQCVDFDTGVLPSAWTLTQAAGGTGAISTAQASSTTDSFYSTSFPDADTAGTLTWSHAGTTPVTSVDLAVDVYRPSVSGDPGAWSGYIEEVCTAIGNARACLYYQGSTGFGVAYWNGTNRVSCGSVMDLQPGVWIRVELQIQSNGLIDMWFNGALKTNCNSSGIAFPSSTSGSTTIGLARIGMALSRDMYFDNAVVSMYR